jgi:hypothetical protein
VAGKVKLKKIEVRKYHVLYGTKSFIYYPSQIELEKGDVIGVAGNHWDGFNKGRNHRNNK